MNPLPKNSLPIADARKAILDPLLPIQAHECVQVRDALGRVLAADVIAPCNVPAHDNSAMDGYAFRFADLGEHGETTFKIVGTAFAGRPFSGQIGSGQAIRIMTGARVPAGADTIVAQEATRSEENTVFIGAGHKQGQNLRRAGEDLMLGSAALTAGTRCGPAELGLIASLGIPEVQVYRRLRVALFSTGDEIASIGRPLGPGQVYDSNRYTLHSALTNLGCDLVDMGVIPDQPEELERAFRIAAQNADVLLTSGGVSVGEADFIRALMNRLGEVSFWQIAIKPGRPMAFGRIGDAWVFGLPGNPVAVMVTFYAFVRDALMTLQGVSPLPAPPRFDAVCDTAIRKRGGRQEYVRARYDWQEGAPHVIPVGSQGAGVLKSMAEANCFIVLESESEGVTAGERVMVLPFHGLL
ncbi:MAG TPA: gephyrin-like molybdotransferase Glp [Azoarcus sp.]|nr:gephyrin-like molybdotransferase Glp [Azoarcus sp.]